MDLCVITKEGVDYKRNHEFLQVRGGGGSLLVRDGVLLCPMRCAAPHRWLPCCAKPLSLAPSVPHCPQGKPYERQFPQKFATGSVREWPAARWLLLLQSPPLLLPLPLLLLLGKRRRSCLQASHLAGRPACRPALLSSSEASPSTALCLPSQRSRGAGARV